MREFPLSKYHFDKMNLRKQIQHCNETTRVMHTCEKKFHFPLETYPFYRCNADTYYY